MAHCGTLLLDEITETPLKFQAKLLRVLEQQDFERVGGNTSIQVNVRIISTSNKDLQQEVALGRFRQDLYYRLSGVRIVLAPLRQRLDDLSDLTWHFINQYAHQSQRQITQLDPCMMDLFAKYHWPGNIRQLRNVVRTSLVLGCGPVLSLADVSWLFDELQPVPQDNTTPPMDRVTGVQNLSGLPLEEIEKHAILDTLNQTSGNQTRAAKILGISDRTLRDKIKRYREQGSLQPA
jgi:transcriptional regulator with PAS, ATPase and Fis domain